MFIPSQFPPLSLLIRNKQFLDPYLNNKQFSLQFSGFVSVGFMSRFMHTCMATPYANVLSQLPGQKKFSWQILDPYLQLMVPLYLQMGTQMVLTRESATCTHLRI